jgi:hypothetical protein
VPVLQLAVVIIRGHQLPNELVNTRNACSTGTQTVTLPLISGGLWPGQRARRDAATAHE